MKYTDDELAVLRKAQTIIARKARSNARAFTEPAEVKRFLQVANEVNEPEREVFRIIFLDSQHRLIKSEPLFYGTIDASPVYPRVIVQKALQYNAAAVILGHNHPSGVPTPSRADEAITKRIQEALSLVDIRVLDHVIVAENETVSFAERGLL